MRAFTSAISSGARKFINKSRYVAGTAVIAAMPLASVAISMVSPRIAEATANPTISGSNALNGTTAAPLAITDLQITATGNPTVPVKLQVTHGSLSITTNAGLSFSSATSGSVLEFSGPVTDVNTALTTLVYTADQGPGTDSLEISLVDPGEVFNPTNGHLYQYVAAADINWQDAHDAAAASTLDGLTGYLVTLTSSDEANYVGARLSDAGWLGASDAAVEGDWKWVAGPEAGTSFWSGTGDSGSVVGGQYNNWSPGEPNNSGGTEDCGQFYLDGNGNKWNDLDCNSTLPGYVVEYGGPGQTATVANKSIAITVTPAVHHVASCTDLQTLGTMNETRFDTIVLDKNIDCTGVDFQPLYQSDGFDGVFDGRGYSISHLTIDQSENNNVGMFSYSDNGATYKNVTLASGSVNGNYSVGSIVGYANHTNIENVHSNLTVTSLNGGYVGGLLGDYENRSGSVHITNSSVTGDVMGDINTTYYVGGLVGYIDAYDGGAITVSHTFTTGNVTGNNEVGGLVGEADSYNYDTSSSVTFNDVYTQGEVDGQYSVGGLAGYTYISASNPGQIASFTIAQAYASGSVSGMDSVGGLVGYGYIDSGSQNQMFVTDTFKTGALNISDGSYAGVVFGQLDDSDEQVVVLENYFDSDATGITDCVGMSASTSCSAVNGGGSDPAYFKGNHVNAPMSAWNFATIWVTNASNYPTFALLDDSDNVSRAVEDAAPNNGDGNGDGVADSQQDFVTSIPNTAVTGAPYETLASTGCDNITSISANPVSHYGKDSYAYPVGLTDFTVTCSNPGDSTTITIYYDKAYDTTGWQARKYMNGTFTTIPGAIFATAVVGSKTVTTLTYSVTDGGALDADGAANGVIVDPTGPAVLGASAAVTAPNTGLAAQSMTVVYVALFVGLTLIGLNTRSIRLGRSA